MAGNFETVGQAQDIEALSTTRVRDVMVVQVTTKPSEIYFEWRVPIKTWKAGGTVALVEPVAANIETIMGSDLIGGMSFTEAVNPSGLLVPSMDIVVQTPAADAFALLTKPLKGLTWDSISGEVIDLVNDLYAVQNA